MKAPSRRRRPYRNSHKEKRAGIQVYDLISENGVLKRKSVVYWTLYGMDGKEALEKIKEALK